MKRPARENVRKYKINQHQTKNIQSLSPPQKQLLKKIENVQRETRHKYEHSMQDNYVRPEQKQEAQDFRVEIEKRFQKSAANKNYTFPFRNATEGQESEADSSCDSLKHVTVYDLASQNQKKKKPAKGGYNPHTLDQEYRTYYLKTEGNESIGGMDQEFLDESDQEVPIEVRIRDKTSSTYRNFIKMLESIPMFSHNSTNSQAKANHQPQVRDFGKARKDENETLSTIDGGRNYTGQGYSSNKQDMYTNFTTQASTAETYKGHLRDGYSPNERIKTQERDIKSSERRERNQIKPLSEEKYARVDLGSKFIDSTKMAQENAKLLYAQNNNLNKSITPQYHPGASNMNDIFSREGHFKTYTNDGSRTQTYSGMTQVSHPSRKNPLENLYHRAQNDVMTNKFRLTTNSSGGMNPITTKSYIAKPTKDGAHSNSSLGHSMTPVKRDEIPKDISRNLAFTNFYGANPQQTAERFSATNFSIQGKSSQKSSANALQITSPSPLKKSNDSGFYTSYDLAQAQFFNRPPFQLDTGIAKRSRGHR